MKKLLWKIPLWFFILTIAWVVVLRFVPVFVTPLMVIRCFEKNDAPKPKLTKKWVPLQQISPKMVTAVVASEDDLFMTHKGFRFKDIQKAYKANKSGKRLRGGSTISQQTAKNVFTTGARTWVRKGFETYFTVLIELLWGKERIMEVYLNVVELGKGIYGVEAAAQNYFYKSAKQLTYSEAALIAAALPNPRRYSIKNPGPYMRRRQAQIIQLMWNTGPVDFAKKSR